MEEYINYDAMTLIEKILGNFGTNRRNCGELIFSEDEITRLK